MVHEVLARSVFVILQALILLTSILLESTHVIIFAVETLHY